MNTVEHNPRSYTKFIQSTCILMVLLLCGCVPDDLKDKLTGSDSSSESNNTTQATTASIQSLGFQFVTGKAWDDTAVRKVLHAFAYGGHATDQQIIAWAEMSPEQAIVEMLTFEEHNLKLSPVTASNYDGLDNRNGTLRGLGEFWSSGDPRNGMPLEKRQNYLADSSSVGDIWVSAATSRGLNPFRQKIGLWETSYHMVVNLDTSTVSPRQVIGHYDNIMAALAMDLPYQDVLTIAATSSGIATQYGHYKNTFKNGVCLCNEDFAREYYQLFFGVLGGNDPGYHETITIKNTAKAFTDITIERSENNNFTEKIKFGTELHYPGVLEMLGRQYWGENLPHRIDQLSQDVINHAESLANLPVKIIADLADDNLDDVKKHQIRSAWAEMQPKNLLLFLRAYAISTLFHSEDRVKYLSSIDRHLLLANRIGFSNDEGYLDVNGVKDFVKEGVRIFRPVHNVFGGQTGTEAASSADVFRNSYNRVALNSARYRNSGGSKYGRSWERRWDLEVPADISGKYTVQYVAEWLWNRIIADGLKHFGPLERAHVYALLATNRDLIYQVNPDDLGRVITTQELVTDPVLIELVNTLAAQPLSLDSIGSDERHYANERVGQALNFIAATPYIFLQEGR